MEEWKRVVRAFIEGLTIDGASQSGEVRMKKLPVPEPRSTGSSFELVAGARFAPDSDTIPVVTARWLYAGVRQAKREMVRIGLAA